MALRLLETHVSPDLVQVAREALLEAQASEVWTEEGGSIGAVVKAIIGSERTGAALDLLHERISAQGGLRVLVTPLDAVLPRPAASTQQEGRVARQSAAAVSREEIYASISGGARLTPNFCAMTVLSSVVAGVGLCNDNTAAVIGAMVVAPLLGPNMGLTLGFTLGDRSLIRDALLTNVVGVSLAFASALALGLFLDVSPTIPELASRTSVGFSDMLLALAAGAAGTLGFTSGAPTYVVGVMVAVALLPPVVAAGLFISAGYGTLAMGALLLAACNVAALNLAGMLTFALSGLRPRSWWEGERARQTARAGIVAFGLISLLLGILVWLSDQWAS